MPPPNKIQVLGELASQVSSNKALVELLAQSYGPVARGQFINALSDLLSPEGRQVIKNPWGGFMTYCA